MKRNGFVLFSVMLFSLCISRIQAEEDAWILAASPFSVSGTVSAETALSVGSTIPVLILERFQQLGNRTLSAAELENRAEYELRQERLALMLELSAAVKKRDTIIFENISEREKRKKREEADKVIAGIKLKITGSAEASEKKLKEAADASRYLPLKIWKNSPSELYIPADGAIVQKQILTEGISALLTGTVLVRGDYMLVNAEIRIYPGGITAGKASDAGAIDDMETLIASLTRSLTPVLLNMVPARLVFETVPEDSAVYFDNKLLPSASEVFAAQPGIHTIIVEKNGYGSVSFTYDFSAGTEYIVRSSLKQLFYIPLAITSGQTAGSLFLNGIFAGNTPVQVTVNNRLVLAEFESAQGIKTFFTIQPHSMQTIVIEPLSDNISAQIEKNRKRMYGSLAGLLLSLPLTFFSYGTYVSAHNSWAVGYTDSEQKELWQSIAIGSGAVTAALGINFAVRLGMYIYTANKIIPKSLGG